MKLFIVLLLVILPEFALTSLVAPPAINTFGPIGFLLPSDATLMRRDDIINSAGDIPPKCKSACPDSFIDNATNCTAKTKKKVRECQCAKGSAFLDQWTKCDACLEVEWVAPGETYISYKPKCTMRPKIHDDLVDSTDDIPPACKSACPDSFINSSSNCTASRRTELRSCQCTKESHLLDQWTKCDACLEVEWVTPGEIYQSFKPNCTGFRSLGVRTVGSPIVLQVAGVIVQVLRVAKNVMGW